MSYGAGIRGDRGRTRGGKDQFNWDDVKNDANRQRYLGNSLHAAVGRWQEGKDLTWWNNKESENDGATREAARKQEMADIRYSEEVARCEALGLPVPLRPSNVVSSSSSSSSSSQLSATERKALLKRRKGGEDADRITDAGSRLAQGSSSSKMKHASKKKRKKSKRRKRDDVSSSSDDDDGDGVGDDANANDAEEMERKQKKKEKKRKHHKKNKKSKKEKRDKTSSASGNADADEEAMLRQAMKFLEKEKQSTSNKVIVPELGELASGAQATNLGTAAGWKKRCGLCTFPEDRCKCDK